MSRLPKMKIRKSNCAECGKEFISPGTRGMLRRVCNDCLAAARKPRLPPKTRGNGKGIKFLEDHLHWTGDECVIWPYTTLPNGYGILGFYGDLWRANRLMCTLSKGPPPTERHEAAHSCGVSECVNPKHLSWKTPQENQADRLLHGTGGTRHRCVIGKSKADYIRTLRGIRTQQSIADEYGVTRETISQIWRGKIYG